MGNFTSFFLCKDIIEIDNNSNSNLNSNMNSNVDSNVNSNSNSNSNLNSNDKDLLNDPEYNIDHTYLSVNNSGLWKILEMDKHYSYHPDKRSSSSWD